MKPTTPKHGKFRERAEKLYRTLYRYQEYEHDDISFIESALKAAAAEAKKAAMLGQHPGCNYTAAVSCICNKCGYNGPREFLSFSDAKKE